MFLLDEISFQNEIVKFVELNELLQDGRSLLKYIGEIAEISIESATSKTLLDEALQAQGVLGGGVAGKPNSERYERNLLIFLIRCCWFRSNIRLNCIRGGDKED